jgi:hypothetical protein
MTESDFIREIRVKGIELVADSYGDEDPIIEAVDLLDSVNLYLGHRGDSATLFYERENLSVRITKVEDDDKESMDEERK